MNSYLVKSFNYWKANLIVILLSAITLVYMEWLFLVTKPSFFTAASLQDKIFAFFISSALITAVLLLLSLPVVICCSLFPGRETGNSYLLSIIPAIVLALSALLLIDNFTYTIFKFGVFNTSGITTALYLFFWCALILALFLKLKRTLTEIIKKPVDMRFRRILLPLFIIAFSCFMAIAFIRLPKTLGVRSSSNALTNTYPNVVLFTADGVNAENMSLYGYDRETTPFLDSIKDKLVISQNHFTNSAKTTGSIVSMMTGKYPTTTRVLFPPDLLRGQDSIEHLPGFLRSLGYYTAQFAQDYYVDSTTQNLRDGFEESNGVQEQAIFTNTFINDRFSEYGRLFLNEIEVSLTNLLKHMFFIETIENPFLQVTQTQDIFHDTEKVSRALEAINQKSEPVFIHVHWMGTHGDIFFPKSQKYSSNIDRENQPLWEVNLYDDAIIDMDTALKLLFDELSRIGELENTIIVITSDHGQQYTVEDRLPLVIFSPGLERYSLPPGNTQNLDIAPTILDLLDVEKPSWMSGGRSILTSDESENVIISASTSWIEYGRKLDQNYLVPPFYQFDFLTAIDCDRYYELNLEGLTWSDGTVPVYVGTCLEQDYSSKSDIRSLIVNRLIEDGFEFDQKTIPQIP